MVKFLRILLLPASILYGIVMNIRNLLYETGKFPSKNAEVFVISVGNLSTGGTGKTPISEFLIDFLAKKGKKVSYLSRGYGRKTKGFLQVKTENAKVEDFGDESLQVANKFPAVPVVVCENRVEGAKKLKENFGAEVIILDDGFQHRSIYRDLEIVVIDAQHLPTRDYVLPTGNLRETIAGLYRADILIINKLLNKKEIPNIQNELKPYVSVQTTWAFCCPKLGEAKAFFSGEKIEWKGTKALAFAGIGNPNFFYQQIRNEKTELIQTFDFPDHHHYTEKEILELVNTAKSQNLLLLTTEKDFIRLKYATTQTLWEGVKVAYIEMALEWWSGKADLLEKLNLP